MKKAEGVMVRDRSFDAGNTFWIRTIGFIRTDLRSSMSKSSVPTEGRAR